jgi:hypothetical protein
MQFLDYARDNAGTEKEVHEVHYYEMILKKFHITQLMHETA